MGDAGSELEDLRAQLRAREAEAVEKEGQLQRYAADLRETFKRERARAQELADSYVATVGALANAVEARDAYTGKHAERVAAYGLRIAAGARHADGRRPAGGVRLPAARRGQGRGADAILFKPHPLDATERLLMERHALIGWEILREVDWLGEAKLVVRHHHERWDGAGYPDGWRARDPAVRADLRGRRHARRAHDRPYGPARTSTTGANSSRGASGTQFDSRGLWPASATFRRRADDGIQEEHS
jgi:ribonuclease P protein subunit RPR2